MKAACNQKQDCGNDSGYGQDSFCLPMPISNGSYSPGTHQRGFPHIPGKGKPQIDQDSNSNDDNCPRYFVEEAVKNPRILYQNSGVDHTGQHNPSKVNTDRPPHQDYHTFRGIPYFKSKLQHQLDQTNQQKEYYQHRKSNLLACPYDDPKPIKDISQRKPYT